MSEALGAEIIEFFNSPDGVGGWPDGFIYDDNAAALQIDMERGGGNTLDPFKLYTLADFGFLFKESNPEVKLSLADAMANWRKDREG